MHFPPVTALEGDDGSHGDDEGCREATGETSVGWRRCLVACRGVEGCTLGHLARGAFVHDPLSPCSGPRGARPRVQSCGGIREVAGVGRWEGLL